MSATVHRGHVELNNLKPGAVLTLEAGQVMLEVAGSGDAMDDLPERIPLIRFTSNTGYFTLLHLFRAGVSVRLGVGSLSSYTAQLAFESGYFSLEEEIRSRSWSMQVDDIARIIHVNGVQQIMTLPEQGGFSMHWAIAPPSAAVLDCPDAGIVVKLGQNIQVGGNAIDGPKITLSYPAEVIFPDEIGPEEALQTLHRIRLFFSMLMGRVLPITKATVTFALDDGPHEMTVHGLLPTEPNDRPSDRLLADTEPGKVARLLDRWLTRFDDLGDAVRLHLSGLEQRKLPIEFRFQIFVQALEALHRRTAPAAAAPIDTDPVLAALRDHGVPGGVVDRVAGVLAHAHEPGLRRRLKDYWNATRAEVAALRPLETRDSFVGRVVATRNFYAHRTDRDDQVLTGAGLWDATELVKALAHMALLVEIGADITGIGRTMVNRRFAEFTIEI